MDEFRPLIVKADESQIGDGQRIRVQGSKNMTLLPDLFIVDIYNLADEDLASLQNSKKISVFATEMGLLCSGEIDDIYTRQEGVNEVTSISVLDGRAFWNTRISRSVGGGSSIETTYRNIMQNAQIGAFCAEDVRLIRGQSYSGRLADCISMLAKSVNARAFLTTGTVFIVAKGRAAEEITLAEEEIIDDKNFATGVRIVKTSVKGYPVGSIVSLAGNRYRLVSHKFDGDSFEGPWESHIILVDEQSISDGGMEGG